MTRHDDGLRRLRFTEGQRLSRRDLELEQSYHLDQHRRHLISHHTWGIALGLELTLDDGSVWVEPGVAVDGYGRSVHLPERREVRITDPTAPAVEVLIDYHGHPSDDGCLWHETPRIRTQPLDDPNQTIRRVPVEAPADPEVRAARPLVDDPGLHWPIPLGRVLRDDRGRWVAIDPRSRVEAALLGSHLEHPADPDGLRLALEPGNGRQSGRVAIYPSRQHQLEGEPTVVIDGDSTVVKAKVEVDGDLQVHDSVDFALAGDRKPVPENDFALYRSAAAPAELRLALPHSAETPSRFVIGTWIDPAVGPPELPPEGGNENLAGDDDDSLADGLVFHPILVVSSDGRVDVRGDLSVAGKIRRTPQNPGGPPPDEASDVAPDLILANYTEGMSTGVLPLPLMRALAIQLANHPEKLLLFLGQLIAALRNNPVSQQLLFETAVDPKNEKLTDEILCWAKTGLETAGYSKWSDPCPKDGSGDGGGGGEP